MAPAGHEGAGKPYHFKVRRGGRGGGGCFQSCHCLAYGGIGADGWVLKCGRGRAWGPCLRLCTCAAGGASWETRRAHTAARGLGRTHVLVKALASAGMLLLRPLPVMHLHLRYFTPRQASVYYGVLYLLVPQLEPVVVNAFDTPTDVTSASWLAWLVKTIDVMRWLSRRACTSTASSRASSTRRGRTRTRPWAACSGTTRGA